MTKPLARVRPPPNAVASGFATRFVSHATVTRTVVSTPTQ